MKILRLELFGYTRIAANNISHLIYTPENPFQLIVGTNGSGKSSLLHELSPLPAHSSNYTKEGYKKITILHGGKTYQLDSTFKTGKHSFLVDGEELNTGGTQEVQKNLVWQHFKINKDIHELMTGEIRLTTLSPADRRKWIQMISRTDYGYVMGVFKRVASRLRDQQGAMKHLNQRLVQEHQNLLQLGDVEGLEERAGKLKQELNAMMLERIPNMEDYQTLMHVLRGLEDQVQQDYRSFFSNMTLVPNGKSYMGMDDVLMDHTSKVSTIQSERALLERSTSEYSEMENIISSVNRDSTAALEDIPGLILEEERLIENIMSNLPSFLNTTTDLSVWRTTTDPVSAERDLKSIAPELTVILNELPVNTDRGFSREKHEAADNDAKRLVSLIDSLDSRIRANQNRLKLMEEAQTSQCPSCKYIWRPGYSDREAEENRQNTAEMITEQGKAQDALTAVRAFLERSGEVADLYRRFNQYTVSFSRLSPFWDSILSTQMLQNDPRGCVLLLRQYAEELRGLVAVEDANRRISNYREVGAHQAQLGQLSHMTQRMATLQEEIRRRTDSLLELQEDKQTIEQFRRKLDSLYVTAKRLEEAGQKINAIQAKLVDAIRNDLIDETVNSHQMELAGITRRLSDRDSQSNIIRDLETSRINVESDVRALDMLTKTLSPIGGLIADQLRGDIGGLVANINSVIGCVWTYEMEVQPCGLTSSELDYRFPVHIPTSPNRSSPDVLKTSKGQRQMIDLAFQLTVMLYLELNDYPLFMDEPGEGFDEQHRIRLMDFVKQLMDSGRHSQLFMISHYASNHGGFNNAEILVLDGSNISLPGRYNQHVVMS